MIKFYIYGTIAMFSVIGMVGFAEGDSWMYSVLSLAVFALTMYMASIEAERNNYRLRREHEKALRRKEK
jgi:hypothetical protein